MRKFVQSVEALNLNSMERHKVIMLLVTYRCNLNCIYCYEPKQSHKRMTTIQACSYIERIVNNLNDSYGSFEIQFMGGEPLLSFDVVREVSEWLWAQSFKVRLTQIFAVTNGTLLNDEMKTWFTVNKDKICLGLSFDGDRMMQDINRCGSASLIDFSYFVSTWPKQTIKVTISPQTLSRLYDGITSLHYFGARKITADLAMGKNIGWNERHLQILHDQLLLLCHYYLSHPDQYPVSLLNLDIDSVKSIPHDKPCGCGEDLVCIDIDGKEYACHLFAPITLGEKKATVAKSILDFSQHAAFVDDICYGCLLQATCTNCPGMNYIATGCVNKQDSFTCMANKVIFLANCEFTIMRCEELNDCEKISYIENIVKQIINS